MVSNERHPCVRDFSLHPDGEIYFISLSARLPMSRILH